MSHSVSSKRSPGGTRAVERALALLGEVASEGGLGLTEVARRVDLPQATALRLLRTLEAGGFVERDSLGAYRGGRRLIQIAALSMGREPLYALAERHLDAIRDETGETAYFGVIGPKGSEALYVRIAESSRSIRHVTWLGRTVPLTGTAVGHALLDQCGPQGYFSTRRTIEHDATAIAAPAYWPDGKVAGALSIVGPTFRISDDQIRRFGEIVVSHGQELSSQLGSPSFGDGLREIDSRVLGRARQQPHRSSP